MLLNRADSPAGELDGTRLATYGTAELTDRAGRFGSGPYMRITPQISWSWNLDRRPYGDDAVQSGPRRTVHRGEP